MAGRTFVEIDHSGDVGIEAWGATAERLFENATLGLFALACRGAVRSVVERELAASAENPGDLLVDWLGEVILSGAVHGEVYATVRIDALGAGSVRGVVVGEAVDASRHTLRFDVKAATYHQLVYEETRSGCHALVIFDL